MHFKINVGGREYFILNHSHILKPGIEFLGQNLQMILSRITFVLPKET